mgnify:CR=1 FL=1
MQRGDMASDSATTLSSIVSGRARHLSGQCMCLCTRGSASDSRAGDLCVGTKGHAVGESSALQWEAKMQGYTHAIAVLPSLHHALLSDL